jgi:hypothetical protein
MLNVIEYDLFGKESDDCSFKTNVEHDTNKPLSLLLWSRKLSLLEHPTTSMLIPTVMLLWSEDEWIREKGVAGLLRPGLHHERNC